MRGCVPSIEERLWRWKYKVVVGTKSPNIHCPQIIKGTKLDHLFHLFLYSLGQFPVDGFWYVIITSVHLSDNKQQISFNTSIFDFFSNFTKSDQIIISWEKQKTPNLPPFSVPSNMFPESATIFSPSKILKMLVLWNYLQKNNGYRQPQSDESDLWSVQKKPSIGNLFSPPYISRILPKKLNLPVRVACVPQGVSHHLTWANQN